MHNMFSHFSSIKHTACIARRRSIVMVFVGGLLSASLTYAKPLVFPDPIRYVSNGVELPAQPFAYRVMLKKLGKPMQQEEAECAWGYIRYPTVGFYDIEDDSNKALRSVLVEHIRFVKNTDKVIFKTFVLDQNTPVAFVQQYKPTITAEKGGLISYQIDIPATANHDSYAYILVYKQNKLTEMRRWEQIC